MTRILSNSILKHFNNNDLSVAIENPMKKKDSLCGVLETIHKLHTLLAIDSVVENNLVPRLVGGGSLAENGLAEGLLMQASNVYAERR